MRERGDVVPAELLADTDAKFVITAVSPLFGLKRDGQTGKILRENVDVLLVN